MTLRREQDSCWKRFCTRGDRPDNGVSWADLFQSVGSPVTPRRQSGAHRQFGPPTLPNLGSPVQAHVIDLKTRH